MRCDMFVRCGAQCEAFYSCAHSGRNESLSNHKVTSTTLVHLRWQLHEGKNAQARLAIITSAGQCFYDAHSHVETITTTQKATIQLVITASA